jgi:hypothetical protein
MGLFSGLFGGGPSNDQTLLTGEEGSFARMLQADFAQQFADQRDVLGRLNSAISPIISAGPNQQGFSPQELSALNAKSISSVGGAYRNAEQALGNSIAAHNGGNGLESGIDAQLRGALASEASGKLADEQTAIALKNYETGRENFWRADAGGRALAGLYDPTAYGSLGTSANALGFKESSDVQNMRNAKMAGIGGLLDAGLSAGLSFATGGISNLGDGGWDLGAFAKGGLDALSGKG